MRNDANIPRFHLAIPVADLEEARAFYTELLGCRVGRTSKRWIDFDFSGHQLTAHLAPGGAGAVPTRVVDGKEVPIRHFGLVLDWDSWQGLAERLKRAGIRFLIQPHVRFEGEAGEQATMFVADPSGNCLEFKSFRDMDSLFAT